MKSPLVADQVAIDLDRLLLIRFIPGQKYPEMPNHFSVLFDTGQESFLSESQGEAVFAAIQARSFTGKGDK